MDTSDFSQESGEMDAGAFSERGHHLQAERESSIVIVMQGNNSASDFQEANRTTISRAHRQVLTEGGLSVTMAAPDQTYSGPSNVQVVTLDVDGSSVGWSSSQDEGVAEEVKDDETWPSSQKPDNVEMMTVDGSLAACLVCGDRASGYHYSVFSCEGCKGFFKRTVQKNLVYSCKDAGNCIINKYTRNSCQRCRFNKCISMGMKKEAVREDRSPGGKHRHKRPRTEHIVAMAAGEIMNSCGEEQEVHDSLLERLVAAQPDRVPKAEGTTSSLLSVNELMQYGYVELKFIIQWAKRVPGFQDLLIVDQMALLKSSFMELNVFRLAYRSMGMENMIKFADQISIPVDEVQTMGWGKELVNATVDFASKLLELNLDLTEFCILKAIVLTYPDASGIQDKVRVMTLQTRILDCLRCYMLRRYPNDNRRFAKMLLRLPALRTVSAKAAERFLSLTLDGSIQLNDIVLEMMN